jgi:glycosyltransferase involved in cell wall biosynthesis
VRSGIADYSMDLLPGLAERCDLILCRLPGQPVAAEIEQAWQPVPAAEGIRRGLPLYQMGNNVHHEAVWDLALEHPGVLTLHDLVLHHLLTQRTLGQRQLEPYLEALQAEYGELGEAVAWARRWGAYSDAALFSLPAHRRLLRRQRGVLVHNQWAAERIAEDDAEIRVRVVPMGIPLPPPADAAAGLDFRRRHGLPESAPLLGSFGFQTPIKRTRAAVAALADPGLASAHLVVVGELSPAVDLKEEARRLGVGERVHITGFVPFEEMEAAIAACDLCVNLRHPTAGETSASLLRVLAVGRPAIVSDYAQFAELPDDVVIKVPFGDAAEDEAQALAARLGELLAEPDRLKAMGEAARRRIRQDHDPARAAAAVVAACEEFADQPPPGDFAPPRAIPTSLTWGPMAGEITVDSGEAPWLPGERRTVTVHLKNHGLHRWLPGRIGPGGVALQIRLCPEGEPQRDLLAHRPWQPLPIPLEPDEETGLRFDVRRPPGAARLTVQAHVLGGDGRGAGTLRWEGTL